MWTRWRRRGGWACKSEGTDGDVLQTASEREDRGGREVGQVAIEVPGQAGQVDELAAAGASECIFF